MYKFYVAWMAAKKPDARKVSSEFKYREIFNTKFNLGFHQPKKDLCEECSVYNNALPELKLRLQTSLDAHLAHKNAAQAFKDEDKKLAAADQNVCYAIFDLQKTLLLPKCEIGPVY